MRRPVWQRSALYLTLAVFAVIAAYPVLWMFLCAGKTQAQAARSMWGLPSSYTCDNFRSVLFECGFLGYLANSLAVTAGAVAMTLAAAALAGFAFARLTFRGRAVLFALLVVGMMVPVHIVLVPLVKLFRLAHLYDTRTGLAAAYVAVSLPVSVFILRGFFAGVPRELEEAARIDGCGDAGVFWHVCLPTARPALAVVVVYNAVTLWNEYIFALTLLGRSGRMTIPLFLANFPGEHTLDVPLLCAALSVSVLPMLAVYVLAQKHIIRGLTSGAIKG